MWRTGLLVAFVAVAVVLCTIPPVSHVVYHYASNYWPPTRAMKVVDYSSGILHSAIVNAAIKLNFFETLHEAPATAKELARKGKLDERGTKVLLNALVSMDLLDYSPVDTRYSLTLSAEVHLIKSAPQNMAPLFLLFHGLNEGRMSKLADYVRNGGTLEEDHAETPEADFWQLFAEVTADGFKDATYKMADLLSEWVKDKPEFRLLDIAAGSGIYGYAAAERYPQARVTLQDWETVLTHTRKNLDKYPTVKESQLTFLPGSVFDIDLQGPYDAIYASQFYHHFNISRNLELSKKIFAALKPGGVVIINDFIAPEPPQRFDFSHLFSVVMLSWSHSGQAFNEADYQHMLSQAGFVGMHKVSGFPAPNSYYIGIKPDGKKPTRP